MTLIPGLAAAVILAWALGGDLRRVASLRFRGTALLYAALAAQLLAFGPVRLLGQHEVERVQLATYGLLLVFCVANRRIPGLWLIAVGVIGNALVIAVNGGVMPVDPGAIVASGWNLKAYAAAYPNVVARTGAPLWFLGDIFAMPRSPGSAVLSVGDITIVAGVWLMLQRITSRRSGTARLRMSPPKALALAVGSGLMLTALALVDAHGAMLVSAACGGAALGLAVLMLAGQRPPLIRCLICCSLLATGAVVLAASTASTPTAALGAMLAGLTTTIGGVTGWTRFLQAPRGAFSRGG